jgi:hypothetical protein
LIKIENIDVSGWEAAIRGMRNPLNSWDKSDSFIPCYVKTKCHECEVNQKCAYYFEDGKPYKKNEIIGTNDLDLMKRLAKAGTDHRKFLRMINVTMDIIAPTYWWAEFDTYKVGTVRNSCSFMHKGTSRPFYVSDFSCCAGDIENTEQVATTWQIVVNTLNELREKYLETKDKTIFQEIRNLLPSGYMQRSTVQLNYEVLLNMYKSRKNHRLQEWRDFCGWVETLPYFNEICLED